MRNNNIRLIKDATTDEQKNQLFERIKELSINELTRALTTDEDQVSNPETDKLMEAANTRAAPFIILDKITVSKKSKIRAHLTKPKGPILGLVYTRNTATAKVTGISPDSPLAKSLEVGTIITAVNGKKCTSGNDFESLYQEEARL